MAHDGSYEGPWFDGTNYSFWKMKMEGHLNSLRFCVWKLVKSGYTASTTPLTDLVEIRLYECNAKANNAILCGLANSIFLNVMNCSSTKDAWEKLSSIYEGGTKVKQAKI